MTIKKLCEMDIPEKIQIDLSGPDGNAFALIGLANKIYNEMIHYDAGPPMYEGELVSWSDIEAEMKGDDYSHLVRTFDKYFGGFVDLYVPEGLDIYPEDKV